MGPPCQKYYIDCHRKHKMVSLKTDKNQTLAQKGDVSCTHRKVTGRGQKKIQGQHPCGE